MDLPHFSFPAYVFPFTIKFIDVKTEEVVFETTLEGPGVLEVPGLEAFPGAEPGDITCTITLSTGEVLKMEDYVDG